MSRDRNRRPISARKRFIQGVTDVMKDLAEEYDHEVAKGMLPFIQIADKMVAEDIEILRRARDRQAGPILEAAE